MSTVAIRELRNSTAEVVARVQAGEEVVLTSRGEPVARIEPIRSGLRPYLSPADVMAVVQSDPGLRDDLAAMDEDTDSLGPLT